MVFCDENIHRSTNRHTLAGQSKRDKYVPVEVGVINYLWVYDNTYYYWIQVYISI